ncbi:hypothetical protein BJV74DRAFT_492500 [Russula compacta]|nr:hypothetical protein BJV74DRAFT_492500 [Russula compacta]
MLLLHSFRSKTRQESVSNKGRGQPVMGLFVTHIIQQASPSAVNLNAAPTVAKRNGLGNIYEIPVLREAYTRKSRMFESTESASTSACLLKLTCRLKIQQIFTFIFTCILSPTTCTTLLVCSAKNGQWKLIGAFNVEEFALASMGCAILVTLEQVQTSRALLQTESPTLGW